MSEPEINWSDGNLPLLWSALGCFAGWCFGVFVGGNYGLIAALLATVACIFGGWWAAKSGKDRPLLLIPVGVIAAPLVALLIYFPLFCQGCAL